MNVVFLGATRGMGRALSRLFVERGDRVFVLGNEPADLEATAADLAARGGFPVDSAHCDLERPEELERLRAEVASKHERLDGLLHSVAFADYEGGVKPFHETGRAEFLREVDVSCFSLVSLANTFKDLLAEEASVVTISISTTRMASESYGYMAPIKAALDSSLAFLAKSFSRFSQVRFNAVASGLLKTSASAGIPGYVDSYLYAEQATLRGQAVQTEEAANAAAFLLSPVSSGVNAQQIVVDAGMSVNYFDRDLVARAMRPE